MAELLGKYMDCGGNVRVVTRHKKLTTLCWRCGTWHVPDNEIIKILKETK